MMYKMCLCLPLLQVLYKPGMAHAGVLVDLHWQDTVIEAFKQVIDRPAGSAAAAAAVTAAETVDTAGEVAAAADVRQAQQDQQPAAVDSNSDVASTDIGQDQSPDGVSLSDGASSADDTAFEDQLPAADDEVYCIAQPRLASKQQQKQQKLPVCVAGDAEGVAVQDYVGRCRQVC